MASIMELKHKLRDIIAAIRVTEHKIDEAAGRNEKDLLKRGLKHLLIELQLTTTELEYRL